MRSEGVTAWWRGWRWAALAVAAGLSACAAPPPPAAQAPLPAPAPVAAAPASPPADPVRLPVPGPAELRQLHAQTRPDLAAPHSDAEPPRLVGLNETMANNMVHIYRAEVCGLRSRAWVQRARDWTRKLLGNVDMEDRRGFPAAAITSREMRDRQLARVAFYERIAPSFGTGCRVEYTLQRLQLIDQGMRDIPLDVLNGSLEARWISGTPAPSGQSI